MGSCSTLPETKTTSTPISTAGGAKAQRKGRGALIVFEGIDRSGKSTQCKKLYERLVVEGKVTMIRFPDRSTEVGKVIHRFLQTEKKVSNSESIDHKLHCQPDSKILEHALTDLIDGNATSKLDRHALHLLFTANRWEHMESMRSLLDSGYTIICDRYSYSGIAYGSANGLSFDWCSTIEKGLIKPDLVVFMTITPSEAESRANYGEEIYENKAMQTRVAHRYNQLYQEDVFSKSCSWHVLDASLSQKELHETIYKQCGKTQEHCKDKPLQFL